MVRRVLLGAWLAVAAAGCSDANLAEPEGLGLRAAQYLYDALDVMEMYSLKRHDIDWTAFRTQAIVAAGNAREPADTYDVIRDALERLGDGHSFFQPPTTPIPLVAPAPSMRSSVPLREAASPRGLVAENGTGYLEIPAFVGGGAAADQLAAEYHRVIENVDTLGVCRWVVDLRGNTGGNMWPMLAGVGPILGEGTAGFFVDADSVAQEWHYESGEAGYGPKVVTAVDAPYALQDPAPPVAVLTDTLTASSGEAIVVAFRGRMDARSFGSATFGVSTVNRAFLLSNNAVLFLTTDFLADRDGTIYGSELPPDSVVVGEKTGDPASDAALDAALAWLRAFDCN